MSSSANVPGAGAAPHPSPLSGLKVLDFTRVLAGPFASRMLCDLGAEVVKVEPPEGDVTRAWGRQVAGIGGYYHQQNAGKRAICLDLRVPGARDLVLELAARADVLIENFRPDVMPRLGLAYDVLRAANPRLVMLSISGFGHGGPQSHRPAYAPVVHAEVGLTDRTARLSATGEPQDLPWSTADTNAALHGLVAILAAVILRERTGWGQHIDLAMIDAAVATDDNLHFELEAAQHLRGLPPEVWQTKAGPIQITADFRYLWRLLAQAHGLSDPADDGASESQKIGRRRETVASFLATLSSWDAVEDLMAGMNLAWGEVRASADLEQQPTVRARGSIVQIDDRAGGTRPIPQSPYRFSAATSQVRGPASHRGEHNVDVLADWLGKSPAAIDALTAAGVLLQGG
jgi:crotonobetainyl-CoA:carnitine CoA-transferase CaiB-like acyl-CoA transferase